MSSARYVRNRFHVADSLTRGADDLFECLSSTANIEKLSAYTLFGEKF
ncbi:MAG: hypothetical protein HWQ38_11215 [Nostoc sp. NMS7]|nr:hypothetical protein [Nostoc sp. NMS7]MBN3947017.1 hypothetical protein [Nostoc sp. NMS7]